jgi:hypothetical protein
MQQEFHIPTENVADYPKTLGRYFFSAKESYEILKSKRALHKKVKKCENSSKIQIYTGPVCSFMFVQKKST